MTTGTIAARVAERGRGAESLSRSALPCAALCVVAALACLVVPGLADLAEYDARAIERGETWRLWTGHFTHWTLQHLCWNLGVFSALLLAWPRSQRGDLLAVVMTSAIAVSLALSVFDPGLVRYRGLSGIDSALFAFVAIALVRDRTCTAPLRISAGALLFGFAAKIGFESAMHQSLFVHTSAGTFDVIPLAHAVGGGVGLAAQLLQRRRALYRGRVRSPASTAIPG